MSESVRPAHEPASSPGACARPGAPPIHIGLALSGGATKAVAHIGVLRAFAENNIVVDAITGTSGGSIVGALFATGRTLPELERIALSMSWKQMAQVTLSRLGILSSDKIERYLVSVMGDVRFEDLPFPFAVVATNLVSGRAHVFHTGRVALACRASCSIPQIYKPVEIDGQYFVDGGLVEELPLAALRTHFAPAIAVGVNLVAESGTFHRPRHVFHLAWRLGVIVSRQSARAMEPLGDVIVRPPLEEYSGAHFRAIPAMMEAGYQAGLAAVPEIRAIAATQAARQTRHSPQFLPPVGDLQRAYGPGRMIVPPGGA